MLPFVCVSKILRKYTVLGVHVCVPVGVSVRESAHSCHVCICMCVSENVLIHTAMCVHVCVQESTHACYLVWL